MFNDRDPTINYTIKNCTFEVNKLAFFFKFLLTFFTEILEVDQRKKMF
jgi:hypothetical protein